MKKITYILLLIILLLPFSCQVDDYGRGDGGMTRNGFTLNYHVSGAVSGTTKASIAPAVGEENLESLYLLFFEYSTNGSGEFLYALDLSEEGQSMGSIGSILLEFDQESGITTVDDYVLLFVANSEEFTGDGFEDFVAGMSGLTENQVMQTYSYLIEEGVTDQTNYTKTKIDMEIIPMSARVVKSGNEESVSVELIRSVSRFDIKNQDSDYTLVSASIWNAYPEISIWDRTFFEYKEERIKRFYGIEAQDQAIKGGLYAFENYVVAPEQNDTETTCLIVGFKSKNATDPNVYYYRVNINSSYLGQQLKRNNVYTTTIKKVLGKGANTEEEAWNYQDFLLEVDINGWDVDHNGSIQYDGENILAVPVSKLSFSYSAETRDLSIFTLGNGTLEISKESLFPGLSVSLVDNTLSVSVENSEEDQAGYVEVRFGNLRSTITITQTGSSTERLDLSRESLDAFPSTGIGLSGFITVTSSGPWVAEIYSSDDENFFSFDTQTTKLKMEGNSGDVFQIYSVKDNSKSKPRYAFVLVTLEDNPEMSRVLILMQKGIGGVDLNHPELLFDASGKAVNSLQNDEYYEVKVTASGGNDQNQLTWDVSEFTGGGNFEYNVVDNQTIRIKASNNTTAAVRSTTFRVRITETGAFKDFIVNQQVHTISIDDSAVEVISKDGGSTPSLTVTSSAVWNATIETTGNIAYFNNTPEQYTISGNSGEGIIVTFPKLSNPNASPVATITLNVTGTAVSRTFTVKQESLTARSVSLVSYSNATPSIASNDQYINILSGYMRNSSDFGRNGVVDMPEAYQFKTNTDVSNDMTLYQVNNYNISSSRITNLNRWWQTGNNMLVFCANAPGSRVRGLLTNKGFNMISYSASTSANKSRTVVTNNKVAEYIFDGPFGTVAANQVNFVAGRACYALSSYPGTFRPILMHPNGGCVVGVDPTLRLIYIGDPTLFSNSSTASGNWGNTYGATNSIFLKNLIAWMTNAAMYGDDFLDEFK